MNDIGGERGRRRRGGDLRRYILRLGFLLGGTRYIHGAVKCFFC